MEFEDNKDQMKVKNNEISDQNKPILGVAQLSELDKIESDFPIQNPKNSFATIEAKYQQRSKTVAGNVQNENNQDNEEPNEQKEEEKDTVLTREQKTRFVRAIYLIVLFQVSLTFLFSYVSSIFSPLSLFCNNIIVILLSNFFLLGSILIFFLTNVSQVFPHNYILLLVFTISESTMIAGWTADLKTDTIILCVGMFMSTTGILTLSLFTMPKNRKKSGLLYILVISIVIQIIFAYFWLQATFLTMLASGLSVLGYGCFLIINTNKISKELPLDEYILGSLLLYIDCLTFFVYLLKAFGKKKGR